MTTDPFPRQVDAVAMLKTRFGIVASQQTISNVLKRHDITRKRATFVYSEQKGRESQVAEFQRSMAMVQKEAWAACPAPLQDEVVGAPGNGRHDVKGETSCTSVAEALRKTGGLLTREPEPAQRFVSPIVSAKLAKGAVNAVVFQGFIRDGIGGRRQVEREQPLHLVLDNARIQHATKSCVDNGLSTVKASAESVNASLRFLPAYCPLLNPTELWFKVTKNDFVKPARPRTETEW
ncbi:hypothetical protein M427DRAFT_56285 [Gonapodya prolifera JEL478]|uniref:Tc1-like transposase DDE domain-containing protein n=1 Tax=Gonapodya prolifera (strain JEL478) TaxID=1344416 RepID=A0A139AGS0_GONPJ|nr:hypothetical protein M427DRAFT_56285 [Gonapodya prolifera JEL478]|eukprot:KXS15987.1 hypothetical protein M427DRAFT_56285 [Gonapodya prolifera JEL478]